MFKEEQELKQFGQFGSQQQDGNKDTPTNLLRRSALQFFKAAGHQPAMLPGEKVESFTLFKTF